MLFLLLLNSSFYSFLLALLIDKDEVGRGMPHRSILLVSDFFKNDGAFLFYKYLRNLAKESKKATFFDKSNTVSRI